MSIESAVGERQEFLKVRSLGGGDESNALQNSEQDGVVWQQAKALDPPFPLRTLILLFETSNSLRQNVDAYATNIDAFGHRFEPIIDLDRPDANQRIAQVISQERLRARERPGADASALVAPLTPTDAEVNDRKKQIVEQMRIERGKLESFFASCSVEHSFVTMRRRLRQDIEVTGNGYLEVLRDGIGEVCEFTYIPSFTMRLLPLDAASTEVRSMVRTTAITYERRPRKRRFRRFVQVQEQMIVYFKEFGDPRIMSAQTGVYFQSAADLAEKEPQSCPATEIIHFKLHSSRSAYGIPRWIGNMLAVMGSRQAEEVNFLYFENKSVPPLALLVSGGHVSEDTVKRIETYIEEHLKGKKNFHKILVIEAEASNGAMDSASRMKIQLVPLTSAQQKDALFQEYDQNNQDKVGMSFRIPRMLRGDVRDFNRSTAEASLMFAERQVFSPEREEFDFTINHQILTDMGIRFWRFQSNAPALKDPDTLSTIIARLSDSGILTPEEGRLLAEEVFHRELARIDAPWTKQPLRLTEQGIPPEGSDGLAPWTGEEDAAAGAPYGDLDGDGANDALPPIAVTPTVLSSTLTVNEVREMAGRKPKMLPDGQPDPIGEMNALEHASAAQARAQQATGVRAAASAFRDPRIARKVAQLVQLRAALEEVEAQQAAVSFLQAKRLAQATEEESETIKVPNEVWKFLMTGKRDNDPDPAQATKPSEADRS